MVLRFFVLRRLFFFVLHLLPFVPDNLVAAGRVNFTFDPAVRDAYIFAYHLVEFRSFRQFHLFPVHEVRAEVFLVLVQMIDVFLRQQCKNPVHQAVTVFKINADLVINKIRLAVISENDIPLFIEVQIKNTPAVYFLDQGF
jgi:hypothetical protein